MNFKSRLEFSNISSALVSIQSNAVVKSFLFILEIVLKKITEACFKRRATVVLSLLDCSSTGSVKQCIKMYAS